MLCDDAVNTLWERVAWRLHRSEVMFAGVTAPKSFIVRTGRVQRTNLPS